MVYGAIAYSAKASAWGSDDGESAAEDADRKALSFCARRADDCKVVASFSNTCAAVAVLEATGATFVATNEKRGIAENQAVPPAAEQLELPHPELDLRATVTLAVTRRATAPLPRSPRRQLRARARRSDASPSRG